MKEDTLNLYESFCRKKSMGFWGEFVRKSYRIGRIGALGFFLALGSEASSEARGKDCLEVRVLKGDSYNLLAKDFTGSGSNEGYLNVKNEGRKLKAGREICIPYERLSWDLSYLNYETKKISREKPTLWDMVKDLEGSIGRNIRVVRRLNNIREASKLREGREIKVPLGLYKNRGEYLAKAEKLEADESYTTRGYSRKPYAGYFKEELRKRLGNSLERQIKERSIDIVVIHLNTYSGDKEALEKSKEKKSAHYYIDKEGIIYGVVREEDRSDSNGESLWQGIYGLDFNSINIEVAGLVKEKQYESLGKAVYYLRGKYNIPAERVLEGSQVGVFQGKRIFREGEGLKFSELGLPNNYALFDHDAYLGRVGLEGMGISSGQRAAWEKRRRVDKIEKGIEHEGEKKIEPGEKRTEQGDEGR